jgi:hypothetical protein
MDYVLQMVRYVGTGNPEVSASFFLRAGIRFVAEWGLIYPKRLDHGVLAPASGAPTAAVSSHEPFTMTIGMA